MGQNTAIAWTHATWNPWWGCTEVGPGCDHCYARIFSERLGKAKWGPGEPRIRTGPANWAAPLAWDVKAAQAGKPTCVFCLSMADFCDNEVPTDWRDDAWLTIRDTPHLRWQILTKRIGNLPRMLPADWGDGRRYRHVGFMASIVNQQEADRDIDKLVEMKTLHGARWIGLSCEPMLDEIDLSPWLHRLDWVVIGGESGKGEEIRDFDLIKAEDLMRQCRRYGVPTFIKQMGSRPVISGKPVHLQHWKGETMSEWPTTLRVQEFPPALLQ